MTCFKGEEQGKRSESPSYFLLFFLKLPQLELFKVPMCLIWGSKSWSPSSSHLPIHLPSSGLSLFMWWWQAQEEGKHERPVPRLGQIHRMGKTDSNSWQEKPTRKGRRCKEQGKNCGHVSNQYSTGTVQGVMCRRQQQSHREWGGDLPVRGRLHLRR